MPIIKMIFVLLLLIPVAILMLWLIARLRDEVPKQPDEDIRERKRRKKEKTSRKERRAARKQQENAVRSGDAERTADTAAGISGAEKNTPDGSGRSGSTASGAASNRQRGTASRAASSRQRGTASGAASGRHSGAASGRERSAGHGAASGRNSADDGLRHPQELKRSERVPFEQSLPPARSNAASSAGRSETLQFPGTEGGRTSADNAKKGTRSEKRPSKRQLRKNRERARKRDLKKQKRDS